MEPLNPSPPLPDAGERARQAERRRCLAIALAEARRTKGGKHQGSRRTAKRIAAAIRKEGR